MKILGLGGLSESGKSYAGTYLSEKFNVPRIKIVKYIEKYRKTYFNEEISLEDFHSYLYNTPNEFTEFFLNKFIEEIYEEYGEFPYVIIESLRNPFFGKFLKTKLDSKFVIVYLDAPFDVRVYRESVKIKESVDTVRKRTYKKDLTKVSQGMLEYLDNSDYIIDNSLSLEELNIELENMIRAESNK